MKNIVIILLCGAVILLGGFCLVQRRAESQRQAEAASLRLELTRKTAETTELRTAQEQAERRQQELVRQADELAGQLQARHAAQTQTEESPKPPSTVLSSSPAETGTAKADQASSGVGTMLAKMMQDPDTRKVIRESQRMMTDQLYAPLVKKMGLSSEQAAEFKDLVVENTMKASENASSMFGGTGSTNQTAALKAAADVQKNFDTQVKALLGEERYAQYKDYQETVAERMQLNSFKQLSGSDYSLSDQQTETLLAIMKEEKKNVAASTGQAAEANSQDPAKVQALFSENKTAELLQAQETIAQRVYERARTILSPDQLESFGKFQTNQLQLMRTSMNMMRKMLTPEPTQAAAAQVKE